MHLLAVEYLLSCENSKYYLSLKCNKVLLPETILYSSLPQPPNHQADRVSYTGTSSGIYIFKEKSFSCNCLKQITKSATILQFSYFSYFPWKKTHTVISLCHDCPLCFQVTALNNRHSRSCKFIVLPVN